MDELTSTHDVAFDIGSPPVTLSKGKKKKDNFIWKDDMVYYLINLWQNEPILYNAKHSDYFDKHKRNMALERILDELSLREFNPLPTKDQIMEKINVYIYSRDIWR